jgi:hypothetical protein
MIRVVVFGFLFANVLCRDLPSVAELPLHIRRPMGAMELLHQLPGWNRVYADEALLQWLKAATALAALLAASGTLTRASVPAATFLVLVHDGILREYSHFFHTGLVPAYCGAVLSFTPCGDGWSIDGLFRKHIGRENRCARYGWSRYAIWVVVAGVYFCAGLSKLRNGGWCWWHGDNLKSMILNSNLDANYFQLRNSGFLAALPDPCFSALGVAGLVIELSFVLVLVSRLARLVLPLAAIGLHAGILFCQGIPFFDLIALQVVLLLWGARAGGTNRNCARPSAVAPGDAALDSRPAGLAWRGPVLNMFLICAATACWIGRVEWYPLTSWQMYSGYSPAVPAWYVRMTALFDDGTRREIRAANYIDGAPTNSDLAKLPPQQARETLDAIRRIANEKHPAGEPAILSVALDTWLWDFRGHPASPTFGQRIHRMTDSASVDACPPFNTPKSESRDPLHASVR